jgi:hypothetical protein
LSSAVNVSFPRSYSGDTQADPVIKTTGTEPEERMPGSKNKNGNFFLLDGVSGTMLFSNPFISF